LTITYLDTVDVSSLGLGGAFQYRRNEGVAQTGSVLDGSETHYLANARLVIGITQAFKVSQMLLVTELRPPLQRQYSAPEVPQKRKRTSNVRYYSVRITRSHLMEEKGHETAATASYCCQLAALNLL
jgi:hypothetical protein